MSDLSLAFLVMGVGMITVFLILGLVVLSGQGLIRVVNRFFPAPVVAVPEKTPLVSPPPSPKTTTDQATLAAIVSTVDIITRGKGQVKSIKKLDS